MASEKLGAAPCQGPDAEAVCPLLLCNVLYYVLVILGNTGNTVLWPAGAEGSALRGSEGAVEPCLKGLSDCHEASQNFCLMDNCDAGP